jgi:IS30 family transposase
MNMEGKKIKSIFLGQVRRKSYYCFSWDNDTPIETTEFVEYKKIYECDLESPPLKEKEKIYISELDATLQVQEVIKSTYGSIIYKTCYTIETISDEKTQEAYLKSQKELEKSKNKIAEDKRIKDKNEYIEKDGISRCLMSVDNTNIIAHFINDNIQLIDTNSKSIITLNNYTIDNLLDFIKHIRTR